MEARIYVGNLSDETSENELRKLFSKAGTVASVTLMKDAESGLSRGFAVVEMKNQLEADRAIQMFHRKTLGSRQLKVILPWHRKEYSSGGYSRGGGNGSGRPGGGYGPGRPGKGRPGTDKQSRN